LGSPLGAYQVSGEYAMINAAAERGHARRDAAMWESVTAIRRAGADIILTYFATNCRGAGMLRLYIITTVRSVFGTHVAPQRCRAAAPSRGPIQ